METIPHARAWCNVTRREPCPACGKPDWCSVSSDGVWCCCRRESSGGTRRTDKSGMEYFLHRLKPGDGPLPRKRCSQPSVIREPVQPKLNLDRYFRLFSHALENVLNGRADHWLQKRRISSQWIERCPNLGFVEHAHIAGWRYPVENVWIIRVPTADGECRGLKIHRENPPEGVRKSLWLPFGTEPGDKPAHCFSTLWPPPEWLSVNSPIYLVEGELKAARACSAGVSATSPTVGARFSWNPAAIRRITGRSVVIIYDNDSEGVAFRDRTVAALRAHILSIRAVTPTPLTGARK